MRWIERIATSIILEGSQVVLDQIASDIETTGLNVDDTMTVVGFAVSMGVRVFVQTDGRSASEVTTTIQDATEIPARVWATCRDFCETLDG